MRTILENKGYRILVARDGNSGLMVAERENPDLLILDMAALKAPRGSAKVRRNGTFPAKFQHLYTSASFVRVAYA